MTTATATSTITPVTPEAAAEAARLLQECADQWRTVARAALLLAAKVALQPDPVSIQDIGRACEMRKRANRIVRNEEALRKIAQFAARGEPMAVSSARDPKLAPSGSFIQKAEAVIEDARKNDILAVLANMPTGDALRKVNALLRARGWIT